MDYSDKKWEELTGGYKTKYNPAPVLQKLESNLNTKENWEELWNQLHHQGDIGDASYVSLVKLVDIQERNASFDWNFYALVGTIELERLRKTNPNVPDWLKEDYKSALSKMSQIATRDFMKFKDPLMTRSILGVLALAKKQYELAAMILYSDTSEINEYVKEHLSWGELYDSKREI